MKLENIRRYPTDLFLDEHGNVVDINKHRWSADGRPLCTHKNNTCTNIAKNNGYKKYQPYCQECYETHVYKSYKKEYCENRDGRLGHECINIFPKTGELEIDHINEDHYDQDPGNYQTLCKSCHTKKTYGIGRLIKSGEFTVDQAKDFFEINKKLNKLRKNK